MATVKFRTNLGSRDAAELGLDYEKCQADKVVEVGAKAAESLSKRGIAEWLDEPKQEIKAVPDRPAVADPKPVAVKGEDKKPSDSQGKVTKPKDK